MTFNPTALKASVDATPMGKAVTHLLAQGRPVNHVVTDPQTGESFVSHGGAPFERAHAFVEAMVNGTEYRDPGKLNPLKASPAEVASMLKYLITYYRRDLVKHPACDAMCRGLAENLKSPNNQKQLKRRKTNYDRWDTMIETLIESLDEMA